MFKKRKRRRTTKDPSTIHLLYNTTAAQRIYYFLMGGANSTYFFVLNGMKVWYTINYYHNKCRLCVLAVLVACCSTLPLVKLFALFFMHSEKSIERETKIHSTTSAWRLTLLVLISRTVTETLIAFFVAVKIAIKNVCIQAACNSHNIREEKK